MALTILTPLQNQRPSKVFFLEDNGEIGYKAYPNVKHFICETRSINCLDDLYQELVRIELQQQALVIRGEPKKEVDLSKPVLRRLSREVQQTSTNEYPFIDVPEHWLCIDIDCLNVPDDANYNSMSSAAIDYAVSLLPDEFKNVSLIGQFSSSVGIFNNSSIKLHLWFWLKEAVDTYSLRKWGHEINLRKGFKLIDTKLYNPVQPHYIVPPLLEDDIEDPIKERILLFKKEKSEVDYDFLKIINEANQSTAILQTSKQGANLSISEAHGYESILEGLGDGEFGEGFNDVLLRATGSLVATEGGPWINENRTSILEDLRGRIDKADQSAHTTEQILRYSSDDYLNCTSSKPIGQMSS